MISFTMRAILSVVACAAMFAGGFVVGARHAEPSELLGQAVVPTVLSPMPTEDPVEVVFDRPT